MPAQLPNNEDQPYRPMTMIESLLAARDDLSQAMKRAQKGIKPSEYQQLTDWAIHLCVTLGRSKKTARNYIDAMASLMRWLYQQQIDINALTTGVLERWQQMLYLRFNDSASTRSGKLTAVRRFFEWREQMGGGINPVRSYPGPSREQHIPRKFTPEQLQKIIGACDHSTTAGIRDRAIILFILSTGARRNEVATLNMSQLRLSQNVGGVILKGKGRKERQVAFEGPVVPALRSWFVERDRLKVIDPDAVFVGLGRRGFGKRLGCAGLNGVLSRLFKKAKLRVQSGTGLHTLRSTFATAMYDGDFDLEEIRLLMGHNDINTTRRYIALSRRQTQVRLSKDFFRGICE